MASTSWTSPDICGLDVQGLYLEDPGNKQEPVGYVLCSEMGNTCTKNGCSCRRASSGTLKNSTKYFGVCVVLESGANCVTSGDEYITCAIGTSSSAPTEPPSASSVTRNGTATTPKAAVESDEVPASSSGTSASEDLSTDAKTVSNTAMSSRSMNSTVLIVIIIVVVVFVALVSWVVRSYCLRRSKAKSKLASRRNPSIHTATSPSNLTGRSSTTPSFPAFDRRTRAMQSPIAGERGRGNQDVQRGRNTPRGREPISGRGRERNSRRSRETNSGRGRRNPDASSGARPMTREPNSGRGERKPNMDGARREPSSGRGRKMPNIDAQFAPNGPRGLQEDDMQREPNSGRGRRDNYGMYKAEAAMRTLPREMRAKQIASPKSVRALTNSTVASSGGTVYTGRSTYERVAQFAQLAAFEAPPPPPPRPQRPIQSVPVTDAISQHVRAPAQNARPASPAPSVPKRQGFYIDESPVAAEYDILSPKTARSLAPSIASSATTVVAPGRNRPTPLQQGRRPQYSTATPSYYLSEYSNDGNKYGGESRYDESRYDESRYDESRYDESRYDESRYDESRYDENRYDESKYDDNRYDESRYDESGFGNKFKASNNYDESFISEVSSMAWSGASGLSDDSYYHAPPSNRARIPVIEAPDDDDDDDDAQSEDAYSHWGHSTQHSSDNFRRTAASFSATNASFFSVKSNLTDPNSAFKEREF